LRSYFALRTVGISQHNGKRLLTLNGKPFFFHGLLDQGYYSDGIYLPATSQGYVNDILSMKACGFNMLRKHIKLEPDIFYYYCDLYGMTVFQDFINNGKYNFLLDTALPTLGKKSGISHKVDEATQNNFISTSKGIISALYNHPCVCYYTVFNEGWGQFNADNTYELLKKEDATRIFDATSGWFTETKSDVDSHHVYFKPIALEYSGRPLVLSEFGGYSYPVPEHRFNPKQNYGYKLFKDEASFRAYLNSLPIETESYEVGNELAAQSSQILARDKDFITSIFKPEPTMPLGEKIDIAGDGDITNDEAFINLLENSNLKTN
jgi:hypothetical protein